MRRSKTWMTRKSPNDCGLDRVSTGEREYQPDPRGNRAERREAARLGMTVVVGDEEDRDG